MLTPTYKFIKTGLRLLLFFTVLTGIIYPLVVTGIAQFFFPQQANGNLIVQNNQLIGSSLIGQSFTDPRYFWGRPSATSPFPYNAQASRGSNRAPSNVDMAMIKTRINALRSADPKNKGEIPIDLVTASGSGLDPDISILSALYQIPRIAQMRKISQEKIQHLVEQYTYHAAFDLFNNARVNVLQLNLALDKLES